MTSRRRKSPKWPWVAVLAMVGLFLVYRFFSGGSENVTNGETPVATDSASNTTPANTQQQPKPRPRVENLPPVRAQTPQRPQLTPTQTQPAPPPTRFSNANNATDAPEQYAHGMALIANEQFVEGRRVLSDLLFNDSLHLRPADAQTIRDTLASVNQKLIFGPEVLADDPVVEHYVIQSGDVLSRIAPRYKVPASFIQSINQVDPRRLHVGQKVKFIRGPFHVRVAKHDYRLDVYLKDDLGTPLYVMSMPVGLGEADSTPVGNWIIEPGRKVKNPAWRNPRTNEYYDANDPRNPIGEYWLALKGTDATTQNLTGYGIHGTVDPGSIGSQASMGCVRLRDADIEMLFDMLSPGESTVQILP